LEDAESRRIGLVSEPMMLLGSCGTEERRWREWKRPTPRTWLDGAQPFMNGFGRIGIDLDAWNIGRGGCGWVNRDVFMSEAAGLGKGSDLQDGEEVPLNSLTESVKKQPFIQA